MNKFPIRGKNLSREQRKRISQNIEHPFRDFFVAGAIILGLLIGGFLAFVILANFFF